VTLASLRQPARRILPRRGAAGGVAFDFAGFADDGAQVGEGVEFAAGADLREQVAHCGGFHGSGDDGPLAGVAGELVQDFALRAAADNVDDLNAIAGEFLQAGEDLAVFQGEAFVGAADEFALGLGHGLARLFAQVLDGLDHVRRIQEAGIVGIDDGCGATCR